MLTKAGRPGIGVRHRRLLALLVLGLGGCGGGSDPLGNPPAVANSGVGGGQSLSFAYFQRCVNPILQNPQTIDLNGTVTTNTCANAGCHAAATGRGGAFRIEATQVLVDMSSTTAEFQASDMYKNFLSAQAETIIGNPNQSLLVNKPLLRNVLHGGGLIFSSVEDPNIKKMSYWISNPMPAGVSAFDVNASAALFASTGGTPLETVTNGACNSN
jgi:hypothetical protein